MENDKQDWGQAYKAISDLITLKVPTIKHVDLYYGQEQAIDSDGNWIPFRCPAVFLSFSAPAIEDWSEGIQKLTTDITVYLAYETVQDTNKGSLGQARAMEFIGVLREIHAALHNVEGLHFGPLSRVAMTREDAPPYMYFYSQTYRAELLDYGANPNWGEYENLLLQLEPGEDVPGVPPTPVDCPTIEELIPTITAAQLLPLLDATQVQELRDLLGLQDATLYSLVQAATGPQLLAVMTAEQVTYLQGVWGIATPVDPSIQLKDSADANIGASIVIPIGSVDLPITAPDGVVTLRNSALVTIASVPVKSNGVALSTVPDSALIKPDGTPLNLPATQPLDIRTLASGIVYQLGYGMWSGQSISFYANDEGALYASGFFNNVPPPYPASIAKLLDRVTLLEANLFGNTLRFTGITGTGSYPSNIVLDHLTGLAWTRLNIGNDNWFNAIDICTALTTGGYNDWKLPPLKVLQTIMDYSSASSSTYFGSPFVSVVNVYSSTVVGQTTSQAWTIASGAISAVTKASVSRNFYACRRFF